MESPNPTRIHAAIALAGITFPKLAERIDRDGFSEKTIRNLAAMQPPTEDDRRVRKLEDQLRVIAAACGLPYAFFTLPLDQLGAQDPDEPEVLERLEALENQVSTLVRRLGGDSPASPPDELLQPPEGHESSSRKATRDESAQGKGAQPSSG